MASKGKSVDHSSSGGGSGGKNEKHRGRKSFMDRYDLTFPEQLDNNEDPLKTKVNDSYQDAIHSRNRDHLDYHAYEVGSHNFKNLPAPPSHSDSPYGYSYSFPRKDASPPREPPREDLSPPAQPSTDDRNLDNDDAPPPAISSPPWSFSSAFKFGARSPAPEEYIVSKPPIKYKRGMASYFNCDCPHTRCIEYWYNISLEDVARTTGPPMTVLMALERLILSNFRPLLKANLVLKTAIVRQRNVWVNLDEIQQDKHISTGPR
ncbi:hypothetical protein L873DRAFT_757527 [Choiromyces venosus 120613-1]|uniref:Uncharacterized protein n=1 Tax=Choiromyces venosus 120613-1 TaxID=1336337 RepID=A0A3N4JUC3_9PEZI|nr:hypothetical protein L873DRAFT_757527 [Choiromyces venosus 120613-1]